MLSQKDLNNVDVSDEMDKDKYNSLDLVKTNKLGGSKLDNRMKGLRRIKGDEPSGFKKVALENNNKGQNKYRLRRKRRTRL